MSPALTKLSLRGNFKIHILDPWFELVEFRKASNFSYDHVTLKPIPHDRSITFRAFSNWSGIEFGIRVLFGAWFNPVQNVIIIC